VRGFRIVRILGVDVIGDTSLVVLGLLLSWVIYLELRLPSVGASANSALAGAVLGGLLFLATVLAHELSHTAMAQRRGLEVKRIRLMIFGGASELREDAMAPETELAVAVVGPVTSGVLGAAFLAVSALAGSGVIGATLRFVGLANVALAAFNLLPGLPLDGGRVLRSILWKRTGNRDRATRMALQSGRFSGLVLIGGGLFLLLRVEPGAVGIWVAFVGWFLTQMAAGSWRAHRVELATRGRTVGDAMRPVYEAVPASLSLARALDLYQVGPRLRTLVVEAEGRIVGILGQPEVDVIAPGERATIEVRAAMTRIGPADVVDAATPLMDALQRDAGSTRLMVATHHNRVVGMFGAAELAELVEQPPPPPPPPPPGASD